MLAESVLIEPPKPLSILYMEKVEALIRPKEHPQLLLAVVLLVEGCTTAPVRHVGLLYTLSEHLAGIE